MDLKWILKDATEVLFIFSFMHLSMDVSTLFMLQWNWSCVICLPLDCRLLERLLALFFHLCSCRSSVEDSPVRRMCGETESSMWWEPKQPTFGNTSASEAQGKRRADSSKPARNQQWLATQASCAVVRVTLRTSAWWGRPWGLSGVKDK